MQQRLKLETLKLLMAGLKLSMTLHSREAFPDEDKAAFIIFGSTNMHPFKYNVGLSLSEPKQGLEIGSVVDTDSFYLKELHT